ncbi:flagellar biosynthetic protein FliO [Legionella dresdenensis]|uniref:Flagellar protein n=1 Tax=Legionella dresdenensis TaxID=450200 RepID=A0ABV8CDG1_9GAMM
MMRFWTNLLWSWLTVTQVHAASAVVQNNISGTELIRVTTGLLFVLAVIVFLSWLLKKLNKAGIGVSKGFTVVACLSLGTREKVMLVKAGPRYLLLGVASGNIATLHDFGDVLPEGFADSQNNAGFADFFKAALRKS